MEKIFSFRKIKYEDDLDQVTSLLRDNLSEHHTTEFFKWKHCENPFGESYGLVACDQEKIVGVRMFMFWNFQRENNIIRAIRPVDTIVHPSYRGRGLFKKLTLQGLETCKNRYDIVFNTPNNNSFPGYLKMGWKSFDQKFDYYLALLVPPLTSSAKVDMISIEDVIIPHKDSDFFQTQLTLDYLKWRYVHSKYKVARVEGRGKKTHIIFRTEKLKGLRTIVILEIIGGSSDINLRAIKQLAGKLKIFVVYFLKSEAIPSPFLSGKSSSSAVVYRDDRQNVENEIRFSAGDLEGKL